MVPPNFQINKKMKTYYKIFRECLDRYSNLPLPNGHLLEYKENEYVSAPDNTRLFVFDSLKAARSYITRLGGCFHSYTIYECHCKGIIKNANGVKVCNGFSCNKSYARNAFWNKVNQNLKQKKKWNHDLHKHMTLFDYHGVCLAKEVKLIKKI
jgi:hypothetical protein